MLPATTFNQVHKNPVSRRVVTEISTSPRRMRRPWRPSVLTVAIALITLTGVGVLLYPSTASWLSSYNQSQLIGDYSRSVADADPDAAAQLRMAHEYNDALLAGVNIEANANIATGSGTLSNDTLVYDEILSAGSADLMARVRIPSIDVDLPVYHGTSDEVLERGAGHLEGSHLPVGGVGTHSVITAHRGLANATMFSNLDQVEVGDRFTIEVLGEVLTYEVRETRVVEPHDTDTLRAQPDSDLVTLITCTPLGINSHRILVTGERVTPTPIEDIDRAGADPEIPGFPWWAVFLSLTVLAAIAYVWRTGYGDAARRAKRS